MVNFVFDKNQKINLIHYIYELRSTTQLNIHSTPSGVWEVDIDLLKEIANLNFTNKRIRSIETGIGLSTIIFGIFGFRHTCIVPDYMQIKSLLKWMKLNKISSKNIKFFVDYSFKFKQSFKKKYDLILIDGNHGFPHPILDYFILANQLKRSGYVIIDDINLKIPGFLSQNLANLDFWREVKKTNKWVIYQLTGQNLSHLQEWTGRIESQKITRIKYYLIMSKSKLKNKVKRNLFYFNKNSE